MIKNKLKALPLLLLLLIVPFKALAYSGGESDDLLLIIIAGVVIWLITGLVILIRLLFKKSQTLFVLGYIFAGSIALLALIALSFTGGFDGYSHDSGFNQFTSGTLLVAGVYAVLVYVFGNFVNREQKEGPDQALSESGAQPEEQQQTATKPIINGIALAMGVYLLYTFQSSIAILFLMGNIGLDGYTYGILTSLLYTIVLIAAIILFFRKRTWGWVLMQFSLLWPVVGMLTSILINFIVFRSEGLFTLSMFGFQFIITFVFGFMLYLMQKINILHIYGIDKRLQVTASVVSALIVIVLTVLTHFLM